MEKSRFHKLFCASHLEEVFKGGGVVKNQLVSFVPDIPDDKSCNEFPKTIENRTVKRIFHPIFEISIYVTMNSIGSST